MTKPTTQRMLCLACSQEFDVDETVYCCPGCGDTGIPADISERPEFRITWHELRCLVMWAEFWASKSDESAEEARKRGDLGAGSGNMRKIVYGIADRLHMQHMDGPPITFSQELSDLRADPRVSGVEQNVIKEDPTS